MRGEFKVGGPGARAGLGGRDPPSIRGLGLSQQEGGLPPSGRTQQGRRGGTLGGGGWERWGEAGAALTTGSGTAAWPRPLGPDPLLRSGRAGEAGRGIHTWRLAWPPTCHLRPGAGPGLAPGRADRGRQGRGGEGSEPKWRLFLEKEEAGARRPRGAPGAARGVRARWGGGRRGLRRGAPPICARGQGRGRGQREGRAGVWAGGAAGRLPAAPSGPEAGRGPGPGLARRGCGRGVRAAQAARRAAHMRAPAPPTFDSFTVGGGGRTLAVFLLPLRAGRDRSGGGGPAGPAGSWGCVVRRVRLPGLQCKVAGCAAQRAGDAIFRQRGKLRHHKGAGSCPKPVLSNRSRRMPLRPGPAKGQPKQDLASPPASLGPPLSVATLRGSLAPGLRGLLSTGVTDDETSLSAWGPGIPRLSAAFLLCAPEPGPLLEAAIRSGGDGQHPQGAWE